MSVTSLTKQQNAIGVQSNHLKLGIIGTANVGKSSLFNMLVRNERRLSPSENCLFRTIDPYIGIFTPPDPAIDYIARHLNINSVPVSLTVADTAGLVAGSFRENKGVGTGSLNVLQSVDLILHVLREFEDENITHYHASIDPLRDMEEVNQEILQYDIDVIETSITDLETIRHRGYGGEQLNYQLNTLLKAWALIAGTSRPERPPVPKKATTLKKLRTPLQLTGSALRYGTWDFNDRAFLAEQKVLSTKRVLYVVNMTVRDYLRCLVRKEAHPTIQAVQQAVELISGTSTSSSIDGQSENNEVFPISLAFEENMRQIELAEGIDALTEYHLANPTHISAIDTILTEVYRALNIIHFYTANDFQVKCWCLKQGKTILESAAIVDVNVARNFLRAEVIAASDYQHYQGDKLKLMIDGKLKSETKKYIVNSGDYIQYFTKKSS